MNGPVTHLGITAGKEGKIYVVNLDDLGKYHTGDDSQIVQSIPNALGTTANGRNLIRRSIGKGISTTRP